MITNNQDLGNVKQLIPEPKVEHPKRPRYVSKHKNRVRAETAKGKHPHRTLGLPEVPLNPPSEYLKKKSGIQPPRPTIKHVHFRRPNYQHKLPEWVPIKSKNVTKDPEESPTSPNFKKQNVINVKQSHPPQPRKRYVDSRHGDAHNLETSGLYPVYTHKKNYGKVPRSSQRKKSKVKKVEDSRLQEGDDKAQSSCRYVSKEERQQLLDGMKKKWEEMMKQFQCLPFLTDTVPRAQRKTKLERELLRLEKDIATIERHPHIYVYSDDEGDQ